ncbi:hypothetical protein PGTUg99_001447 [Puccinia graminis f. sp. tritici]|uniref:Glycoside hydrolase 131 catalytic N-terminal domain-containing protein n=1 Tax=Puccinia graminis f. sp. tritici TaxID=56615 RepID=A0A5B0QD95_PUCGR|nr:hypothetical protein PGTUg99_001447 [Puccinia graminis f. sp. tritici]
MSQRLSSASSASLFLLVVLSALVAPSLSKILLDYRIPPTAKVTDMGDKTTALGKLTKATITGKNSLTEAYQFMKVPKSQFQVVALKINDNSIFKDQLGFRRNDIVPEYNAKLFETGTKTYHHSFIFTKGGKLDLKHGYLLASVEFPDAFDSKNTAGTADKDANKIRVRDINFKTLFDVDVKSDVIFNFAIEVDWKANSLSVYHSTGDDPLKQVVKPAAIVPTNPKAVKVAGTGEWHIQMIKEPLPNPADPVEKRSDVPHNGIQEKGINESIIALRNFIEDKTSTNPDGPAGGADTTAGVSGSQKAGVALLDATKKKVKRQL